MLLGIDVGGTHTDAVLIDSSGIVSTFKTKTDHTNLLKSITTALEAVSDGVDKKLIKNINLSTTLSTNAIIQNRLEKTGLFVSSGPGIDPDNFIADKFSYKISGSIDHRGKIIQELDTDLIQQGYDECAKEGITVFAAVTKFSTRNKSHENQIAERLNKNADFITMGHSLSSQLSFPRRVATAYFNSAVWRIYNYFTDAMLESVKSLGIDAPVNILKADGGTVPVSLSREYPVESILSGPAASIMGIIALCDIKEDSVILDIGGTTTDIAVFASGSPLIERDGIKLAGYPTLIRSLQNKSIGIGGDSAILIKEGRIKVGPQRLGPSMSENGEHPTLTDALNVKGITSYMDTGRSEAGMKKFARKAGLSAGKIAEEAIKFAVKKIRREIEGILEEINEKPVYTIHEMLEGSVIVPKKIYIIGGPARALAKAMNHEIEVHVPENFEVANAIGAALAKTTFEAELFADTIAGKMIMPNIGIEKNIDKSYTLHDAKEDAVNYLVEYLKDTGFNTEKENIDITESSNFKMIDDYYSSGNDIRVRCQIKPGVTMKLHQ